MFGYAARYGVLSKQLADGFHERIMRGAFDKALRSNPDVVCLFNHDVNKVLGRTGAGTLRLSADSTGLSFECDLPNTSYAKDLSEGVERGDMKGCSFAFRKEDADFDFDNEDVEDDGVRGLVRRAVRTIRSLGSLLDVSIVTTPAYPGTSVALRSIDANRGVQRHFESRSGVVSRVVSRPSITAAELNARIDENYCSFNEVAEFAASERARRRRLIQQALQ
jgi:hypothetical protein